MTIDNQGAAMVRSSGNVGSSKDDMDSRYSETRSLTADELAAQTRGLALELEAAFELGKGLPRWLVGSPMRSVAAIERRRAQCDRANAYYARIAINRQLTEDAVAEGVVSPPAKREA
jgi:hypothetical protein